MEEDGDNHRHSRIKTNHQMQAFLPEASQHTVLNTEQDSVFWPPPIHTQQVTKISDKMQSSAPVYDQLLHDKFQNSASVYDQIQQNSLTFNEGRSKSHASERKKIRPRKRICSVEKVNQVKTSTKQPDSEGNQHGNLSYANKEDQLNWTVKEIIQGTDHYHRVIRNSHETSFNTEDEEISKGIKQAAAPAFKAPRAQ
jgi:hypothetical protein